MSENPKRIVILGGGFAGVTTAMRLEKEAPRQSDLDITLVNRDNFFLFTPMLHEVAASDLDLTHIVNPVRKLLKKTNFFHGDAEAIDLERREVTVSHGGDHHHHTLPYDHLVIGLGSITNFFNIPGLEKRAFTMKSLGDAIHLRNHLISQLEEADFECCSHLRQKLLTVVVAGGGFAGVETIGGVNDFVRDAIKFYPHLREDLLRLILVHPGNVVLPELSQKLGIYTQRKLSQRGIEVFLNTRVEGVWEHGVTLSNGRKIPCNTLVWTAGTAANPVIEKLPCGQERGRISVTEYMDVPGHPGLWALGDCANIPDRRTGKSHPPTAQHALREGKVVAHNILTSLYGGEKRPFDFRTIGQLAAIGKRTGVANIFGMNFSGFVAWWFWRTIYLSKLPRFEKKVRVALDWTLDVIFSKDLVQYLTVRAPAVSHEEDARPAPPAAPPAEVPNFAMTAEVNQVGTRH